MSKMGGVGVELLFVFVVVCFYYSIDDIIEISLSQLVRVNSTILLTLLLILIY